MTIDLAINLTIKNLLKRRRKWIKERGEELRKGLVESEGEEDE